VRLRSGRRCGRDGVSVPNGGTDQSLFGIVQGGLDAGLRVESARDLVSVGFDGYAVGGLSVGEDKADMYGMLDVTVPELPSAKPRYLMGVGMPEDLVEGVARGIDMFDCVVPSRH
jgi:queuine tRNA-ribosyltransferase